MRSLIGSLTAVLSILLATEQSRALPVFAHRYGLSCQACHATIPHLNEFGNAFLRAGFLPPPGTGSHNAFPVAVKLNFTYSSAPDPNHLPKVILDELEFLAAAPVTSHVSYRVEQYAVDGGVPGRTRDAWLRFASRSAFGDPRPALRLTAGQFTLPLPEDPETQRETLNHYAVFDQTVGSNPFNLFDARLGLDAAYGREGGGVDFHIVAVKGHDPQSGLPTMRSDTMLVAQAGSVATRLSAYRYDGHRPLLPINDRFWRQALGANQYWGKAEIDILAQTGRDTSADGAGTVVNSNGGFAQLRWTFTPWLTGVMRYDATRDDLDGLSQALTTSLIFRVRPNMRFTVENVSGSRQNVVNAAWLMAY